VKVNTTCKSSIWHEYMKAIRAQQKWEQNKHKAEHSVDWRKHTGTLTESS